MKIVYVNPLFTDGMGYIENCLPKAMAKRGHEVHIVTSTGKVYFNDPLYKGTYEKFFGPPIDKIGTTRLAGNVTLHRLDFISLLNTFYFIGLKRVLEEIRPDVVHMWDVITPYTFQCFFLKKRLNYVVYTSNHYLLSVLKVHNEWNNWFSMRKYKWLFLKVIPGRLAHSYYERCYAATADAKFVAEKYMGVPAEKCQITPLGVDTDVFKPAASHEVRTRYKTELGLAESDFIVLYTGRFAPDKNPLLIAKAIDALQKKGYENIKGLFVGSGDQKGEIQSCTACQVIDFVPYFELYRYYQIADVGVWPSQESTSMLDAAASGVPIIVNHTIRATERYEGNGLTYKLGSVDDLTEQLLKLYKDAGLRLSLGRAGQMKMSQHYSWDKIAREREEDYLEDLKKRE